MSSIYDVLEVFMWTFIVPIDAYLSGLSSDWIRHSLRLTAARPGTAKEAPRGLYAVSCGGPGITERRSKQVSMLDLKGDGFSGVVLDFRLPWRAPHGLSQAPVLLTRLEPRCARWIWNRT